MKNKESIFEKYKFHPQWLGMKIESVNTRGAMGDTVLHVACNRNNIEDIKELICQGADVNAQGDRGFTPLHIATI